MDGDIDIAVSILLDGKLLMIVLILFRMRFPVDRHINAVVGFYLSSAHHPLTSHSL